VGCDLFCAAPAVRFGAKRRAVGGNHGAILRHQRRPSLCLAPGVSAACISAKSGQFTTLWTNPATGTWSVTLAHPDGWTCVIAAGRDGWEAVVPAPGTPG
jgi:hypothetical protein